MDLTTIEKTLGEIRALPQRQGPEQTLFSIGARGYFENPTTDVLAFFCDPDAAHGLGDIVLSALFDALAPALREGQRPSDLSLSFAPERELSTENNKRIDLLLKGGDWLMVIESKIFHQQNNPFTDYKDYIQKHHSEHLQGSTPVFVVLSPEGSSPDGWLGLSYAHLITAIKQELADHFIQHPLNKWTVLLRDFLIHLGGIMSGPSVPTETVEYIIEHLGDIHSIEKLKQDTVKSIQETIRMDLQSELGSEIGSSLNTWGGYPALRYYFNGYKRKTEVVLFLDGREGKKFNLHSYVYDVESDQQRAEIDEFLEGRADASNAWNESHQTIRAYWEHLPTKSITDLTIAAQNKLSRLREYERKRLKN